MNECIFCKIAKGEIPSEIIYENENFFSIFDISPQVEGHALIISKKHFNTILDMPSSLGSELLGCIKGTSLKIIKSFEAGGFNIVNNTNKCAGQIVNHIHFHILPRRDRDGLNLFLNKKE